MSQRMNYNAASPAGSSADGSTPVVHVRPTVRLEGFFLMFTSDSVRESHQIRLPFGEGKTSPVAVEDVARVLAALLANPEPHIGKIDHLTGPQSENMYLRIAAPAML